MFIFITILFSQIAKRINNYIRQHSLPNWQRVLLERMGLYKNDEKKIHFAFNCDFSYLFNILR